MEKNRTLSQFRVQDMEIEDFFWLPSRLVVSCLGNFGTEEQKQRFFPQ